MNKVSDRWIKITEDVPELFPTGNTGCNQTLESSEPVLIYLRNELKCYGQRDKSLSNFAIARYTRYRFDDNTESYNFLIEDESGAAFPTEDIIAWMPLCNPPEDS